MTDDHSAQSRHFQHDRRNTLPAPHEFSDEETHDLLRALFCYIEYYDWDEGTITSLVAELAQSQDKTTDAEDEMRRILETRFHHDVPGAGHPTC